MLPTSPPGLEATHLVRLSMALCRDRAVCPLFVCSPKSTSLRPERVALAAPSSDFQPAASEASTLLLCWMIPISCTRLRNQSSLAAEKWQSEGHITFCVAWTGHEDMGASAVRRIIPNPFSPRFSSRRWDADGPFYMRACIRDSTTAHRSHQGIAGCTRHLPVGRGVAKMGRGGT